MSEDEGEEDEGEEDEDNYSSDDDGKFGTDINALRKRDEERNDDF